MNAPVTIQFEPSSTSFTTDEWEVCFPPPLEGRFWYEALESSRLEDQFQFRYARLSRGGRLIGIAPCFVHDLPMSLVAPAPVAAVLGVLSKVRRSAAYQRTLFIGSPCSDEGTIGLASGVSLAEVAGPLAEAAVTAAREAKASMVVFKDAPEGSLAALGSLPEFCPTLSYPGTIVALPPPDKERYYRSLSHLHRHNHLKKLRRSREILETTTDVIAHPAPTVLEEIRRLFQNTYERGKTKFERLGLPFFQAISQQSEARYILLRDTKGALVAFMLVFVVGSRVINKFIGLDYQRDRRTALYFRLFDAAVDFAYSVRAAELQSGQTGYRAKFDLGHRPVPLYNVFHHRNWIMHRIYSLIGAKVTWQSLDSDLRAWCDAHPHLAPRAPKRSHS